MAISDIDTYELLDRFNQLIKKYVPLANELAIKVERFGKYRKELQSIVAELKTRDEIPQEHKALERKLLEVLEARADED